jgi:hypothetical protein
MTDGKAGTIDHVYLDDVHGLRISIAGHVRITTIATTRYDASRPVTGAVGSMW